MVDAVLVSAVRLIDAGTWSVSDDPPSLAVYTAAFDIAAYDGRPYSGAAPGATLLAAAAYAVLKPVFARFDLTVVKSPRTHRYVHNHARLGRAPPRRLVDAYLLQISLTWLVIAPLMAAFGVRFVEFSWREGAPASKALALGLAATLASFLLYYASIYSRQALASLLVWHAVLTAAGSRRSMGRILGAAALLAFAVTVEYGVLAIVALLLGAWLPRLRAKQRWAVLGVVALSGLGLGWYHASLFGSPWSTPYQHRYWPEGEWLRGVDPRTIDRGGIGGIGAPRVDVMLELLLGSYKGILWYCPALALAAVGHVLAISAPGRSRRHLFCVIAVVTYLALNSAMGSHLPPNDAKVIWGGLNILWGPRHLLITIPFLAFGLTGLDWSASRVRWGTSLLLGIAFCINLVGCSTRQQFLAAASDDPRLDRPVVLAASFMARDGLRIPLLDAHGVNPAAQLALLGLLTAGSILIVVLSVRWLGEGAKVSA